jgi:Ca2+-binding EF-hand superfamily protein
MIGIEREKDLPRMKMIFAFGVATCVCLANASFVLAQSAAQTDPMLNKGPPVWDANHDGVYTCDEWKTYMDRLFKTADHNHDGKLDQTEFASVRKADASLADADFGYFDENQDGRITHSEFVEKPSPFILRFDTNGDCRVTSDEIKAALAQKGPQGPAERPRDRFH